MTTESQPKGCKVHLAFLNQSKQQKRRERDAQKITILEPWKTQLGGSTDKEGTLKTMCSIVRRMIINNPYWGRITQKIKRLSIKRVRSYSWETDFKI